MQVRIYKPAKTAMQSGQRNTKDWLLESEPAPKEIDPLMGWTSSRDMKSQISLAFDTQQEAIAYAAAALAAWSRGSPLATKWDEAAADAIEDLVSAAVRREQNTSRRRRPFSARSGYTPF